jgi:hypothetical protein
LRRALLRLDRGVLLAPAVAVITGSFALAIHGPVIVETEGVAATTQLDFA